MATFKVGQKCECLFQGEWFPGRIVRVFAAKDGPLYSFQYQVDGLLSNNVRKEKLRPLVCRASSHTADRVKQPRGQNIQNETSDSDSESEGPRIKRNCLKSEDLKDDLGSPPPYEADDNVLSARTSKHYVPVLVQAGKSQKIILLPTEGETEIRATLQASGYSNVVTALLQVFHTDFQTWIDFDDETKLTDKSRIRVVVRDLPSSLQSLLDEKIKIFEAEKAKVSKLKISRETAITALDREIAKYEAQRSELRSALSGMNQILTAKMEFTDVAEQLAALEQMTTLLQEMQR